MYMMQYEPSRNNIPSVPPFTIDEEAWEVHLGPGSETQSQTSASEHAPKPQQSDEERPTTSLHKDRGGVKFRPSVASVKASKTRLGRRPLPYGYKRRTIPSDPFRPRPLSNKTLRRTKPWPKPKKVTMLNKATDAFQTYKAPGGGRRQTPPEQGRGKPAGPNHAVRSTVSTHSALGKPGWPFPTFRPGQQKQGPGTAQKGRTSGSHPHRGSTSPHPHRGSTSPHPRRGSTKPNPHRGSTSPHPRRASPKSRPHRGSTPPPPPPNATSSQASVRSSSHSMHNPEDQEPKK